MCGRLFDGTFLLGAARALPAACTALICAAAAPLIYWAVQRCRMSESPCRLTVSLRSPSDPAASSPLRVSVSDTGVGSKLEEFLELDALARETPVEKWDGTLLITTTGINDKAIYHYQFNLQEEASSSARFSKLATTNKNNATFSGTEVCICLSNEADLDEFILWLTGFVRKIFVLRAADLAIELTVEQTGTAGSRNVCLPHDSDDAYLSIATPNIERLVSGLKDYALSHGNTCEKCDACCMNRDRLKVGTGSAKIVDRRRDKGLLVEVVIMIAHTATDLTCWMVNCSSSQVLYFEDFIPCPISQSFFNVLMSMDWQSYGFKLKGGFMDDEGNAVLQWDNLTFARVDIAIHTYHGVVQEWQRSEPDKYLVRKALKSALCRLKEDHAGDFLSCHGKKIREYVPDLAESIAGLILSSNDQEFQDECFTLLGLGSDQDISEGAVRSCFSDKMASIIEMNDTKENVVESTPYLFECEKLDEDSEQLDEEDGDEDMVSDY
ncbi:type 2 DNA topoisomerase 6 subunit B-like [Lolium rigidum]|uniref:type 2 DNA topoisomerase 6 subunit B-like n=1 Tax=Lolium rigidum TaxID=89674 RepID=UPI001F5C9548|nr:type 2 DNA topoisomerase 6 subunit B-like [Lolium rigidum]